MSVYINTDDNDDLNFILFYVIAITKLFFLNHVSLVDHHYNLPSKEAFEKSMAQNNAFKSFLVQKKKFTLIMKW